MTTHSIRGTAHLSEASEAWREGSSACPDSDQTLGEDTDEPGNFILQMGEESLPQFPFTPSLEKKVHTQNCFVSDKHVVTQCCLYIRRPINNIFIFFFNIRLERKNLFLTSDMQIAILNTAEGLIPDF